MVQYVSEKKKELNDHWIICDLEMGIPDLIHTIVWIGAHSKSHLVGYMLFNAI